MAKINLQSNKIQSEIKLNYKTINKIKELAVSNSARNLLETTAQNAFNFAKPKLPENMKRSKSDKNPKPMKNALIITPITEKPARFDKYEKIPSLQTNLKFKPRKTYMYVMLSGNNTYNGVKRPIKYTNPNAEPFILNKAVRIYEKHLYNGFIDLIRKEIKNL